MEHASVHEPFSWQRLLHRWFVQYNPLYFISAMLCLVGVHLLSRGLAAHDLPANERLVAAITELYSVALIGGAALLTRLGRRRPAVMLALLAAVYQGDLTLHTEAAGALGTVAATSALAWFALFVAKLFALAWAVEMRISRVAALLATYGAAGLAAIPYGIARLAPGSGNALVALWVFGGATIAFELIDPVTSIAALDDWGRTVLRRAVRAVWILWALLALMHIAVWCLTLRIHPAVLLAAGVSVWARLSRREARVYVVTGLALCLVAWLAPQGFSLCATMTAVTLMLRAYRHRQWIASPDPLENASPFRASDPFAAVATTGGWALGVEAPGARKRLAFAALCAGYLAIWTLGWSGGPWPSHLPWLDLAFAAVTVFVVARHRSAWAFVPLALVAMQGAVSTGLVSAPRTTLAWGVLTTTLAFALLLGSLAVSLWTRRREMAVRSP